jgi:hypothetical protein
MTNLHIIGHFKECEGHSSTNDHLIHFVQHVLNQLNFISNLCTGYKTYTMEFTDNYVQTYNWTYNLFMHKAFIQMTQVGYAQLIHCILCTMYMLYTCTYADT